jgi:hypothetical protein
VSEKLFELAECYGDWDDFGRWTFRDNDRLLAFVDAIVRTHTPEDVQKIESKWVAEPVAWREVVGKTTNYYDYNEDGRGEPLYAAPQPDLARVGEVGVWGEWVGLTDEERRDIREWQEIQNELGPVWAPMMLYLYLAIEAKLKEKNCG